MAHRIIASWTEDRGRRKKSFAVAFVNYTTGVNDSLVVKKTKLSTLPKFGSLRGGSSASLNIWGNFGNWQKI